ncbi:MAG: TRAP transporter large permease [Eubacteriales bacterium]|nr:TRAP transporter large permease [Eubacteriales bacterium]
MIPMLLVIFLVLMIGGAPIAVALGCSTIIPSEVYHQISLSAITKIGTGSWASYLLVACPLFTFSGDIMAKGGISKRLVNVANLIFGNITGGIGMVAIVAAMIFAAISGTGSATVSAIGMMMIPEMVKCGYDRAYGTSMVAAAGTIGTMIPPSICMVVYAVTAGVSITSMFTAGIPAGILVGVMLCLYCYISSKQRGYTPKEKVHHSAKEVAKIVVDAIPALLVPVIILGGIYSGLVTPTESAALGCVVGIIVSLCIYKEVDVKTLPYLASHSMTIAAPVMFIIAMSSGFGSLLSMAQVPKHVAEFILGITDSRIIILLVINVIYLIMGTFMETNACIILMTPILLPVVTALGVSPVHFGIITIVNLAIGFVTPPLGANLFMASAIGHVELNKLSKTIWPWIIAMIIALILITYIPAITLALPTAMGLSI